MRGAQAISSVICHAEGPAAGQRVYDLAEAKTQWSHAGSEPGALNTPEPCKPQERAPLLLLSLLQAQGSCTASQQPQHLVGALLSPWYARLSRCCPWYNARALHLTQVALPRASQLPPWDHLTALPTTSSGTLCPRPHQGIRMRGQDSSRRRTFCMPSWHGPTYSGGGVSVLVSDTLSWLGRSSSRMT